jgi:hypothetical protein
MNYNITKSITYLYNNPKTILSVYFTYLPYSIYKQSTNNGNFAVAGIGLGLIKCQRLFWTSIFLINIVVYYKNSINNYVNLFLFTLCGVLFIKTLLYTIELLNFFESFLKNN